MNTGLTCVECGCRRTHARLVCYDKQLTIQIKCMKCGSTEEYEVDSLTGFDSRPFKQILESRKGETTT